MKLKHTPGPWRISCYSDGYIKTTETGETICNYREKTFSSCLQTYKEVEANGHIIAAAPEMLDALIAVYRLCKKDCPESGALISKQVIEKATGMKIEEVLADE